MIRSTYPTRLLMCRPDYFAVSYAINPWMNPDDWARRHGALAAAARRQWTGLYRTLRGLGATIDLVTPDPGLPDLVFTANAAVVLDGKALLARFRHPERRGEEPHFTRAFETLRARGVVETIRAMPPDTALEGAGDCVFDASRRLFWMGYGQRSDAAARPIVEETFGISTVALELVDPRFYHMDTALCPLSQGEVMYVPDAFAPAGLDAIRARVAADQRIEVATADAALLAANAVCLGDTLVLSACGDRLRGQLTERGYRVITTPLHAFLRSGGSAFCLTLRLDRRSAASNARERAVA